MELISVRSSAISAIGYNPTIRRMHVKFKHGKTYTFGGVPQHVFDAFLSSSSKGRYYDLHIRDRYQCE